MKTAEFTTAYNAIPEVSALNKVPGFDPLRFLRATKDGPKLDLKYKKLWFRLKYPAGRIKLVALKITDQLAMIEARVYFDDSIPASNFTATQRRDDAPGGLYIEAAQYAAMDQALSDAGFGIQFSDMPSASAEIEKPGNNQQTAIGISSTSVPKSPQGAEPLGAEAQETVATVTEEAAPAVKPAAENIEDNSTAGTAVVVEAPQQAALAVENVNEEPAAVPVVENAVEIAEDTATSGDDAPYSPAMPVDDICSMMTVQDAGNYIVPIGTCKGWTMSQVADRRPFSLKWYLNGYSGDDNILRAAAKLLLSTLDPDNLEKAS